MADKDKKEEFISIPKALEIAHGMGIPCAYATMIAWVNKNKLGYQALGKGGRYMVNKTKLEEFLTNGPEEDTSK